MKGGRGIAERRDDRIINFLETEWWETIMSLAKINGVSIVKNPAPLKKGNHLLRSFWDLHKLEQTSSLNPISLRARWIFFGASRHQKLRREHSKLLPNISNDLISLHHALFKSIDGW